MGDLQERVEKFQALELPGQPMMMHMGTFNLVLDLWQEVERLDKLAKLQGQEISITRERDEALEEALQNIAAMDPKGIRADDLGRAARFAAEAIAAVVGGAGERS